LFYLLENSSDTPANVRLTHLVEGGTPPIVQPLVVPPFTRYTVDVNAVPELASAALSTVIMSDVPLVAERAMYLNAPDRLWEAGAASGGAIAPATSWSFAEGATGFFHTYLLLGNPDAAEATATVSYHLPDATTVTKTHVVPPESRRTIDVNAEDPLLTSTALAISVDSTVPIVAERAMWWNEYPWKEGSSVIGSTVTGNLWAIGEGVEGGPLQASTFVLVANASATEGTVRLTVVYDDGTNEQKEYALLANARLTARIGDSQNFPNSAGRRFSVLVESLAEGVPITVEYARYQSSTSLFDSGGAAVANRIR
jgi:P pilus assembly chaperone PapD